MFVNKRKLNSKILRLKQMISGSTQYKKEPRIVDHLVESISIFYGTYFKSTSSNRHTVPRY